MKRLGVFVMGIVFLMGLVVAQNSLYNVMGIDMPGNIFGGDTFEANFSFGYLDDHENWDKSPLIVQLNFSSLEASYPVWRGDFEVSGYVERYTALFGIPLPDMNFVCSNEAIQDINHVMDGQRVYADNGTFYCYDENGHLELSEDDIVHLYVTPHQAIYPGDYNLTAAMFYISDERGPRVNITNKVDFVRYYRENDNVLVLAEIDDGSSVLRKWANVTLGGQEIFYLIGQDRRDGVYPFSQNTPSDIAEGYYNLTVSAEDEYGNIGNDSVVLGIDRTGPVVELVSSLGIVSGDMSIVVNVTDEKAGLDSTSVEYRIREMNGSSICPGVGVGTWSCYDSGWKGLDFMSGDLFGKTIDTVAIGLNGEYWLEIRATDVLGNLGELEG